MTTLYSNNFDSETAGAAVSGWSNIAGTWQALAVSPVSGANAYGSTGFGSLDTAIYTAMTDAADMGVLFSQKVTAAGTSGMRGVGPVLRSDASYGNAYLVLPAASGVTGQFSLALFKRVAGGYTLLSNTPVALTFSVGDTLWIRSEIQGTTIRTRIWKGGTSEPGTWAQSVTDSSVTAAGNAGLILSLDGSSPSGPITIDDLEIYDFAAGGAANITLSGPSSGTAGAPSTNFTVGADGTITGTITVTPDDAGDGGTFTPTSVNISAGTPTATFTYTAATAGVKSVGVTNNGSLGNPSDISYTASAAAATQLSLSGPTSGTTGSPSTNFTVSMNGTYSGTLTVTPTDSSGAGSFTPGTVGLTTGSPSATFTYTPSTSGARNINVTNNSGGSIANPASPIVYTAGAGPVTVAVTDSAWRFSPYNWHIAGGVAKAVNGGAYGKIRFTGTSFSLGLSVASLVAAGETSGRYPTIRYSVDNGPYQDVQLTPSTTAIAVSGLASGTHTLEFWYLRGWWENVGGTATDRWTTPSYCIAITGLTIDAAATVSAPTNWFGDNAIWFADSIGEGIRSENSTTQPGSANAMETIPLIVGEALGCNMGNCSFGGQSYSGGFNSIPGLLTAYSSVFNGASRLSGGVLTPSPKHVFDMEGANGGTQAECEGFIAIARTIAPTADIWIVVPVGGQRRAEKTAAVAAYLAANPSDTKVHLIDLGTGWQIGLTAIGSPSQQGIDSLHPTKAFNGKAAAALTRLVQQALGGGGTTTVLKGVPRRSQ